MAKQGFTGITVSTEFWEYFNSRRKSGETMEDVILRISKVKPFRESVRSGGLREVKDNSEADEPEYDEKSLETKSKKRKK